ncbi:MAG: pyridoxal-phosphate dependent enzyme [Promethearchaeota archaeon]|nr:MAG: pyridoxal-phosphate dependent enzyme [Candidatus Lokiarchaeota archaeon]
MLNGSIEVSFEGIEEAFQRINGIANKTPVMTSRTLNMLFKSDIYFKCENFQRVGAFKFRGAFNTLSLLSEKQKERGVITHSSGNHAQAIALAASLLGIKATIVMPRGAPGNKINATKGYGVHVVFCDNTLKSRNKTTQEIIKKERSILIHPYDNDNIINGQGTVAYELIKEVGSLDIVIAPLGGGGLLCGTALAAKGLCSNISVIGVEPSLADDALRSLKAGYIIPSDYPNTIADGLRTSLCERTFDIIRTYVDDVVTVSEIEIINAMKFLWERMKIIVEPSGAVSLAAILSKKVIAENKKIGIIISGGNIDLKPFFQLLEKDIL